MENTALWILGAVALVALAIGVITEVCKLGHDAWMKSRRWRLERRDERERSRGEEERRVELRLLEERRAADREEPRVLAERLYAEHADLLRGAFTPEQFRVFMRLEMHDALDAVGLWEAYRRLLGELQPHIDAARERGREEVRRQARRRRKLRSIEEQIADEQHNLDRLYEAGQTNEAHDYVQGIRDEIRRLERERERLLNDEPEEDE